MFAGVFEGNGPIGPWERGVERPGRTGEIFTTPTIPHGEDSDQSIHRFGANGQNHRSTEEVDDQAKRHTTTYPPVPVRVFRPGTATQRSKTGSRDDGCTCQVSGTAYGAGAAVVEVMRKMLLQLNAVARGGPPLATAWLASSALASGNRPAHRRSERSPMEQAWSEWVRKPGQQSTWPWLPCCYYPCCVSGGTL